MNDDELLTVVRDQRAKVPMTVPVEQVISRGRAVRARRRIPALAGALTAAAAAGAAAALVLAGGPAGVPGQHATAGRTRTVVTAAWTVREDADGTVTIYLRQYANPAALQQTLQADGINAIVFPIPAAPACTYAVTTWLRTEPYGTLGVGLPANAAPQAVQLAVVTFAGQDLPASFIIHPDAMPPGSALFLPFMTGMPPALKNDNTGIVALSPVVLNNDTVPACVPKAAPAPTPAPKAG
jgi:hypothetical protein